MLEFFALVILLVLVAAAVAVWVMLGMLPGRIARSRNHPQADAIEVCGWCGVLTMGILCPLAFIWAYTRPPGQLCAESTQPASLGHDTSPAESSDS